MVNKKKKFNKEIPKNIKVKKEDIIFFSNMTFFVNLSDCESLSDGDIELEQIGSKYQYRFVDYDPYELLFDKFSEIVPEEEIDYMRNYKNIINIFFKG